MHNGFLASAAMGMTLALAVPAYAGAPGCYGNLAAAQIESCLQPTRSLRIGPPAPAPSANLTVQFDFDSAQLTGAGTRTLAQLAEALRSPALQEARFEIAGHTDAVGSDDYNLGLSRRRAEAVRAYLAHQRIDPARLTVVGYGAQRLYTPDRPSSPENRRVEVTRLP